jgi:hypothetical protein
MSDTPDTPEATPEVMTKRVVGEGRYISVNGGVSWMLTEPTKAWLAAQRAANGDPAETVVELTLEERVAALEQAVRE